jgi:hypothetical protein
MFYCKQCLGCGWNTGRFPNGCEAFNEMPMDCRNYISFEDRWKVEKKMEKYEFKSDVLYYKRISGNGGKWVRGKRHLTSVETV